MNKEVVVSHTLMRKASIGMYYVCADYPYYTHVWLLFSTAIPTSLSNFKQIFLCLYHALAISYVYNAVLILSFLD